MKFSDVIAFSLVLAIFCSVFSAQLGCIKRLDTEIEKKLMQRDSLAFISKSFCGVCKGKGFTDFEEWKNVCRVMWKLESIEFEYSEESMKRLYVGKWNGPYGKGEVYYCEIN